MSQLHSSHLNSFLSAFKKERFCPSVVVSTDIFTNSLMTLFRKRDLISIGIVEGQWEMLLKVAEKQEEKKKLLIAFASIQCSDGEESILGAVADAILAHKKSQSAASNYAESLVQPEYLRILLKLFEDITTCVVQMPNISPPKLVENSLRPVCGAALRLIFSFLKDAYRPPHTLFANAEKAAESIFVPGSQFHHPLLLDITQACSSLAQCYEDGNRPPADNGLKDYIYSCLVSFHAFFTLCGLFYIHHKKPIGVDLEHYRLHHPEDRNQGIVGLKIQNNLSLLEKPLAFLLSFAHDGANQKPSAQAQHVPVLQ